MHCRFLLLLYWLSCFVLNSMGSRLDCLQYGLGKELNNTSWTWKGFKQTNDVTKFGWVYNNSICPLDLFSVEDFCLKAVGCGKKLLLVGDSTVEYMAYSLPHLIDLETTTSNCPTENGCHKNSPKILTPTNHGCINGGNHGLVREMHMCQRVCPKNQPVTVTYIRHDYIRGLHGQHYYKGTLCEHWQAVAHKFDYLFVSIGPHVQQMVRNPYGKPAASYPNYTHESFFASEANITAHFMLNVTRPDTQLIFRTGPVGVAQYKQDCSKKIAPYDSPPELYNNFSWPLIPLLNGIYVDTMRSVLGKRLLVMDTTTLMHKIVGCRHDPMHFFSEKPASPILLEWLVLQNLLMEQHRVERMVNGTVKDV